MNMKKINKIVAVALAIVTSAMIPVTVKADSIRDSDSIQLSDRQILDFGRSCDYKWLYKGQSNSVDCGFGDNIDYSRYEGDGKKNYSYIYIWQVNKHDTSEYYACIENAYDQDQSYSIEHFTYDDKAKCWENYAGTRTLTGIGTKSITYGYSESYSDGKSGTQKLTLANDNKKKEAQPNITDSTMVDLFDVDSMKAFFRKNPKNYQQNCIDVCLMFCYHDDEQNYDVFGAGNVAYDIPSIAAGESYQKGDIVEFAGYLQGKNPNPTAANQEWYFIPVCNYDRPDVDWE